MPEGSSLLRHPIEKSMIQDSSLLIAPCGDGYRIYNEIDRSVADEATSAAAALTTAVDRLAPGGGEIRLSTGVFLLDATVELPGHLRLIGSGPGTVVKARGEAAFSVSTVQKVTIADMTVLSDEIDDTAFDGSTSGASLKNGIIVDNSGECLIRDVHFQDIAEVGLWVRNNTFLSEVRGCRFANCAGSGLRLEKLRNHGRGGGFVPNIVTNCLAYSGGNGFETINAIVVNFVACEIGRAHV